MSEWIAPQLKERGFHCLHCHFYADQKWVELVQSRGHKIMTEDGQLWASSCSHCHKATIWAGEKIIYPTTGDFPPANPDLPDEVKKVYAEAGTIAQQSPRAACALLRLAVQMLLEDIGETGPINEGIRNLVKRGVDPTIQQAMDIVRVTGNHAVHPGKIDVDDITNVQPLFEMINIISEVLISQPNQVKAVFDSLPDREKNAIANRDKGAS